MIVSALNVIANRVRSLLTELNEQCDVTKTDDCYTVYLMSESACGGKHM